MSAGDRRETFGQQGSPGTEGFALLTVVWAISLVSLCATIYMSAARTRSVEASAAALHARANAAARAGMMLGIADLVAAYRNPAVLNDDAGIGSGQCQIGGADVVRWMATSESGRVDLNTANEELLDALLRATAAPEDDWVAASSAIRRSREAMNALSDDGKAPAFRSSADLARLPELSHAQFERLRPFVTVHSGRAGLHPGKASPDLLTRLVDRAGRGASSSFFVADVPGHVYRLVSEAVVGAAVAQQRAIVEINPDGPVTFAIREWRDGVEPAERAFPNRSAPDCRALQAR
ncbi:MAG: hypothetical protein JWN07_3068 [Hyphomicrobiales bacterium]|nr:hypothetical protein [Hyphomicrobiales bacterium]